VVFSDLTFIYAFLPSCLLAYWLARSLKVRNYILLAASLLFYGLGEPVYIFLMLAAAGSAYSFAFLIDEHRGARKSRIFLAISILINVSFLFFYKYAPLFIDTAALLFKLDINAPHIKLPIGISFYTFQILTYTVDIYRGKIKLQTSPVKFLMYVSMFPQLIAGPIVKYGDIENQIDKRYVNPERFAAGVIRFVCGLAKKVLIADYAGGIADFLLGAAGGAGNIGAGAAQDIAGSIRDGLGVIGGVGGISTLSAWVGLLLFGVQIYFDFSGYSDMAIGLGRMFGFEFMENFRHPFNSKSVSEFWRRWHISLGEFFRYYVYIPLGGNRRHQLRNIAVVWLLTGFWHGASWNFVMWGCYYGLILIAEKYLPKIINIKPPAFISWACCFFLVLVGWSLFYFTDLALVWDTVRAMFTYRPELNITYIRLISDNLVFLAVCLVASMPWARQLYGRLLYWGESRYGHATAVMNSILSFCYASALLLICSAVRVSTSYSPFMYFRF
jgi:alginate O-acetyltransferase complex protein AlgI